MITDTAECHAQTNDNTSNTLDYKHELAFFMFPCAGNLLNLVGIAVLMSVTSLLIISIFFKVCIRFLWLPHTEMGYAES